MNLAQFLNKAALRWGERPALAHGARRIAGYAEFHAATLGLGGAMRTRLGLRTGDRVGLALANSPAFMTILFACWQAGLVAVPINAKLHAREFRHILGNCGAILAFVDGERHRLIGPLGDELPQLRHVIDVDGPDFAALCGEAPVETAEVAPDDVAWLFYTSGTTGRPKGAMLTHRNLIAMTMNYFVDVDMVVPDDCIIHCAPMSHGSGLYALPHVARGALQVVPASGGFDPAETLGLIAENPGASFFFAPTMIVRLLRHPGLEGADLGNLKTIVYGGAPMYTADLVEGLERLGPVFVQIYGQGEAPMTITGLDRATHLESGHPRFRERLASVGTARTDVEVRILGEDGRPLTAGETGEIVVRGDVVMKGYWNDPEATAATLPDGWLHTGDLGAIDEDGFVTLKDRSKDLIITGGTNVYPREIEEVLLTHPAVLEASVVGKPDPEWGESIVAFVVLRDGASATADALDRLCLDNIARFKRPKDYRFVDALPKNNYGKVLKTELRAALDRDPA